MQPMAILSFGEKQLKEVTAAMQSHCTEPAGRLCWDIRSRLHCPTEKGYARVQHKAPWLRWSIYPPQIS